MAIFGTLIKGALGGFGKKPEVPTYTPVDPSKEQGKAIQGNLDALPGAQKLAAQTNKFNLGQLQSMLRAVMPGYEGIQNQISQNIQGQLKGELPPDVQARLQDSAAVRSIGGGYGGTGMHGKLVARDFGMTSYQMTQQGLDSANRWMALNAQMALPSMMDSTSMFLSPQQRIAYQFQNTQNQFQRDWTANQVKAAPDPFRQALGDAFIEDEQEIMQMAGGLMGMMGGMCWIAREVYGEEGIEWRLFRRWLLRKAPKWFRNLYRKYGERFAAWLHGKESLKAVIKKWMNPKVEWAYESICRS